LQVSWCAEKVVKILIERVSIVLETRQGHVTSAKAKQRAEEAAKQLLLEDWEARLDENLSAHHADNTNAHDAHEEPAAYRAFLDKLEVSIESIDFVYSDTAGTLGLHVDAIALKNEAPTPSDEAEHTIKSASITGLSVYIDPDPPWHNDGAADSASTAAPSQERRDAGGGAGGLGGDEHFLLQPCSATVRVGYDTPTASHNLSRPRVSVAASIAAVALELKREQLLCAVKVMDLFDLERREILARPGRPSSSALDKPHEWWRYAKVCMHGPA